MGDVLVHDDESVSGFGNDEGVHCLADDEQIIKNRKVGHRFVVAKV